MKDVIFCSLPPLSLSDIYSAPAVLKGVVTQHGFTASTKDFGIDLFRECNFDHALYLKLQNYFTAPEYQGFNHGESATIDRFFNHVVEFFKNTPSKYIGISVLSNHTHKSTLRLLTALKDAKINSIIIAGGRGLDANPFSTIVKDFNISISERFNRFGALLHQRKLADYVVYGDGEDAIVDILSNTFDDTESILVSDSYENPTPDYSDYEFDLYQFNNKRIVLPVTGSKGCVRNCDFCDVPARFGRYRYRSGIDIANEIVSLSNKYNVHHFHFTDSLVNGGLKPLREFLEKLATHNQNSDQKITWSGQYISRPPGLLDDDYYALLSASGAEGLTIGAESGSNYVLDSMQKKTTVEGLFYDLEMFRKHNLTCCVLTFVGHWSERYEDFVEHCKMFVRLVPYVRSGTVSLIGLGHPFFFNESLPTSVKDLTEVADFSQEMIWLHKLNTDNTFKERVYRRLIIGEIAERLQFPTKDNPISYHLLETTVTNNFQEINKFYQELGATGPSPSQQAFNNFDHFWLKLVTDIEHTVPVKIAVESGECRTMPDVEIKVNDHILHQGLLENGVHWFNIDVIPKDTLSVSIKLLNKGPNDTIVNNNQIVADKFVKLKALSVMNINILEDYDFFYTHCQYQTASGRTSPSDGLWENGTMLIEFNTPITLDYCTKSTKNIYATGDLTTVGNLEYATQKQNLIQSLEQLK